MDQEMTKPLKTVTTEYFEELVTQMQTSAMETNGMVDDALRGASTVDRRIKALIYQGGDYHKAMDWIRQRPNRMYYI